MDKPIILYGLANLLNSSFEESTTSPPANWSTIFSVNQLQSLSTVEFHSAGIGIPSIHSHQQNVNNDTAGNVSFLSQRVQVDDLINIVRTNDQEIAVAAMVKLVEPGSASNVSLIINQFTDTTLTVGAGTSRTPPSERSFISGDGPEWLLYVTAQKLHADTNRLDIVLSYSIATSADYSAGANVFWDRVFVGGLVDFTKGIAEFTVTGQGGFSANIGDGVAELVRLHKPSTDLSILINNIVENTSLDLQLKSMMQMMGSDTPPEFAFWLNRHKHTNGERHYQRVILDSKTPRIQYPAGFIRRMYSLKGTAYSEFVD